MALTNHIVPDSPTNNFCTLNPLKQQWYATRVLKEGNLLNYRVTHSSSTGTLILTGKQYWEVYSTYGNTALGVIDDNANQSSVTYSYDASSARGIYNLYGAGYVDGSGIVTTGGPIVGYTTPSVIMFAVDIEAGKMWVGKDGVWDGDPDSGTNPFWTNLTSGLSWTPWVHANSTTQANDAYFNFGQDPSFGGNKNTPATVNSVTGPFAPSGDAAGTAGLFYYPPPAGFKALCTANLPEMTPDVAGDVPADYFKAVLYTGNGGTQSITGVGFQPDLVWIKSRNNPTSHGLYDSVRGVNNVLFSDSTEVQSSAGKLSSFNTDGFSLNGAGNDNTSSKTYIAWCWESGGNSNTFNINGTGYSTYSALQTANTSLPASSTSGMIVPSGMSINTDAGFSIVKYSGNGNIPHGLSSSLDLIIVKNLDLAGEGWTTWHSSFSSGDYIYLQSSNQKFNKTTKFSGVPTSTVFQVGADNSTGSSSYNYIAYCWHSVENYSKFGSYTGNGSPDGPFVYTGFRPAWVMVKRTDVSNNWVIHDAERNTYNVVNLSLLADSHLDENDYGIDFDFLSNGFKLRSSSNPENATSGTYIFMAFSEQPFKFSNAR